MPGRFDVFFSYNTVNHAAVTRVARALHDRGIRIFLDRWYLAAGQPWPQALEQTLAACGAVAVFVGAIGLGPWQQRERDLALDRQGREPGFPVIPVLFTRGDPGLGFLRLNTWVDLSGGITDDSALDILASAIRGEPPGPLARQRTGAILAVVCPYRGLQPFREEDEPFFFGRSTFAETLTAAVSRRPFVAVVGASGGGKSSVVRAGLIPRLRRGAGGFVWDAVTLVPTDRPLTSLAASLLPALEPDLSEVDRLVEVAKLAARFADGTVALRDVAARVLAKQPGTDRLLLFVDQWEELYTLCADEAVRRGFIGHLLEAAATDPVRVVLTLRGDFMGRALDNRDLSDRLQDAVVTIGPMTRDELAETIIRPAEKTGLTWESGLPEMILDDVGDEPGGLPLLEFLLQGLWAERRGTLLTHEAYLRLGRVSGAIAHRAEDVFERNLTDSERQAARRLLIRMVRPGEGAEDTRRRTALPQADPVAEATIRKLTSERLVVTERDVGTGKITVEVAHEALIRGWRRLRGWVDQDREFLRTRERIAGQARLWEHDNRASDRLLPPGRPLAEAEDLLINHRDDLELPLIEYIEASVAAEQSKRDAEKAKEEAERTAERRRTRTARRVAAAMLALAACALSLVVLVFLKHEEAWRYAEQAQRNESRALAALANIEAESGSPATALRVALAAVPENLAKAARAHAREAEGAVNYAVQHLRELRRIAHGVPVSSVAFSPDGRTLATGSSDKTARLWEVASGKAIVVLRGHEASLSSVAFSPDGRTLATGSSDKTARLWEVASGKAIVVLRGHEASVRSVAFSPDGRTLATGSSDKTARLWEVASGKAIVVLRGHEASVRSVAFSSDGRTLATGSSDNTARLWEVASGKEIGVLRGHEDSMLSVAFSPDGRTLATGSSDHTARLWEVASGKEIGVLRGHEDSVSSVAFSPDGSMLATGSSDNTARLWEVASGKAVVVLRGHETSVWSVAFSPDGSMLATGSLDNTARLWEVASSKEIGVLRGHEDSVWSVAFSPDGRTLATGSSDNTARLWEVASGKAIVVLRGHEASVSSVAFSPDGRTLATGSSDNTARLWEVASGKEIGVLPGHEDSVSSVAFSPDGRTLATGSSDNTARLWEVASGKEIGVLRGHEDSVSSVAFSPDGRTLATGSSDNTARLWEVASGKEIVVLRGHEDSVRSVAFSPDGRTLATGSRDKTARLWEVASGKEIVVLRGHEDSVRSVAFSPDGRTLATGSRDKTARLWEVASGKEIGVLPGHEDSGKEIVVLRGHESAVWSVAFSPDGRTLATSSRDKTARLWEVASSKEIGVLPGHEALMRSVAFTPDGRTLATGLRDKTAWLWPLGQGLIDIACARVHDLPLGQQDKQRFGIDHEWCTPEVSAALRAKLGLDQPAEDLSTGRLGASKN